MSKSPTTVVHGYLPGGTRTRGPRGGTWAGTRRATSVNPQTTLEMPGLQAVAGTFRDGKTNAAAA